MKAILWLTTLTFSVGAAAAGSVGQASTGKSAWHDSSPPLRDMAILPPWQGPEFRVMPDLQRNRKTAAGETPAAAVEDPALQLQPGVVLMPAPIFNFNGMGNLNAVLPPSPVIAVGPGHVVEVINVSLQIYNKSGTSVFGPVNLNTLWAGFGGPCQTGNDGDPEVLHDQIANRWLISQFVAAAAPFGLCVAVSQTPDPTGAWNRYFFQFNPAYFYDLPKFGLWPDGYYLGATRYDAGTLAPLGAAAIVIDRSQLLLGLPAPYQEFDIASVSPNIALQPADLDGPVPPPAGAPGYFMNREGTNQLQFYALHADWAVPANSTFTGPVNLPTAAYTELCPATRSCVDQRNTTVKLDGHGESLMNRLAYRNFGNRESLVLNHAVAVGATPHAAFRWYEVRLTGGVPAIFQQGTYAPDSRSRWMASLAMDASGNVAAGYSVASNAVFPSIRYAGRLAGDPAGQLPQSEATLVDGGGSQTSASSRWGDYVTLAVDPVDDCTFWFASEYLPTTSNAGWQTRIAAFRFASCASPPRPVPDGQFVPGLPLRAAKNGAAVNLTWSVADCKSSAYNLYRGAMGSFGAFTGASCGLAPTGTAAAVPMPGNSFFVLTGAGGGRIAPFGHTDAGVEENFTGWPELCPEELQLPGATC